MGVASVVSRAMKTYSPFPKAGSALTACQSKQSLPIQELETDSPIGLKRPDRTRLPATVRGGAAGTAAVQS
ncbi:hypothetical protein GCM10007301_31350 [Azorhizobium oxalatiphilum]|uniref:Uncharacterized protein n=1 Tax=Azorhizobium oxalatiphilum TaxID=980631 RepID=A0A917C330_9HYPH|nr:hypothetical protein GCM10007301_31350 [Azorhizobium oxalatiphilum]